MVYKVKDKNKIDYYDVTIDKDKLKEIFDELGKYQYNKICCVKRIGYYAFRFPATIRMMKKRIIQDFNTFFSRRYVNPQIIEDSILCDRINGYIKYDFKFISHTDLYKLIDVILNDFSLSSMEKYPELFVTNEPYAFNYKSKVVIDKIVNYLNSSELTDCPEHDDRVINPEYDYKKVQELYKRTLECFHFKLSAIKEFVDSQKTIDGEHFKSRILINNNKVQK